MKCPPPASHESSQLTRRTVVHGAAWSAPTIALAAAAPAIAQSQNGGTLPPPVFGIVPGSYLVRIPAGIHFLRYDIAGAAGGKSGTDQGTGLRMLSEYPTNPVDYQFAVLDLRARSLQGLDTYLVVKVGSMGKSRAEAPDNNYRRGASLGGFGGRRASKEGVITINGGDGGGSTGVFYANQTTPSHQVSFSQALLLAAGGGGAPNTQQTIYRDGTDVDNSRNDRIVIANSWPGSANKGQAEGWAQISTGPLAGYVRQGEDGSAATFIDRADNNRVLMAAPAGPVPATDLTVPVTSYTDPGAGVFPDGGHTELYITNDARTAVSGGHGSNAPYSIYETPLERGWGAGGGGGGWVGGASGLSFRHINGDQTYDRQTGTAGAPGLSFFTDQALGTDTATTQRGTAITGVRVLRTRSADASSHRKPWTERNDQIAQFSGIAGAEGFQRHAGYFKFWWLEKDVDTNILRNNRPTVEYLDIV